MTEIDHECTYEIVCPYCGYEFSDSWEYADDNQDEHCGKCGKYFEYTRDVDVTYTSKQKD